MKESCNMNISPLSQDISANKQINYSSSNSLPDTQKDNVSLFDTKINNQLTQDTFDYSKDDGKISTKDKLTNFGKGIVAPITNMFKSPKNLMIGLASIAGISALTVATGGAIAPLLITAGITGGAIQLGTSAYKAYTATTDDEAKQAWQGMGTGTSILVGSVAGAKAAAKGAAIEGAENMNHLQATAACIKNSPKALNNSFKSFTSGEFITNLGIQKSALAEENLQTENPKEPLQEKLQETPTETEIKAEPKTEIKPESEPATMAEVKAELEAEPKPKAKIEPNAEPKVEAEVEVEPKAEPNVEAEVEVEPKAEPKVEAEVIAEPKVDATKEIKSEAKTEALNAELAQASEVKSNVFDTHNVEKTATVENKTSIASNEKPKIQNPDSIEAKMKNFRSDARKVFFKGERLNTDNISAVLEKNGITKQEFDNYILDKFKTIKVDEDGINLYDYVFGDLKSVDVTPETTFYHGTTKNAAEAILKDGYDLSKATHYESGKGIYAVTTKPDSNYIYGDGTCLGMHLKNNAKFVQAQGGVSSKINDAAYAFTDSDYRILGVDSDVIQNVVVDQLKNMGYSGMQTATINSRVPYTVIWDPSSVEFTQAIDLK